MDGVVCATMDMVLLVWKEGGLVVWHVLVRDIMFDAFLPYLSPLLGWLVLLSVACVKIYILFTLLFTLYSNMIILYSLSPHNPYPKAQYSTEQHSTVQPPSTTLPYPTQHILNLKSTKFGKKNPDTIKPLPNHDLKLNS